MARKPKDVQALPELNEIESEMSQVRSKGRFRQSLKGTFGALVVVVAIAVIIAFILLPVLKITNGHNMEPGFQPGDIILLQKTSKAEKGDVCAFYFNNKLLLRRVIAKEGDVVEIDEHGYVKVNDEILDENDYISEHAWVSAISTFLSVYPRDRSLCWGITGTMPWTAGQPTLAVLPRMRFTESHWPGSIRSTT